MAAPAAADEARQPSLVACPWGRRLRAARNRCSGNHIRGAARRLARAAGRRPATALRVTLVSEGDPPPATSESSVLSGPILGLRHAPRDLGVTTQRPLERTFCESCRDVGPSDPRCNALPARLRGDRPPRTPRPKKRFVVPETITSGPPFSSLRNVTGIAFDDRQLGYLSGYLAASWSPARDDLGGRRAPSRIGWET